MAVTYGGPCMLPKSTLTLDKLQGRSSAAVKAPNASFAFQKCKACKKVSLPPLTRGRQMLSSSDSLDNKFRRLTSAMWRPRLKGFNQRRVATCALQDEGEAVEAARSKLERQLSNRSAVKTPGVAPFDKWPQLLSILFVLGAISGPLLDGIHSVAGLQVYDTGAIEIGSGRLTLKTDIWVFPILGVFYAVVGGLYPFLDDLFVPPPPKPESDDDKAPGILAATWGATGDASKTKDLPPWLEVAPPLQFIFLAFLLSGSAFLYRNDIGFEVIWPVLMAFGVGCWAALDATWWGFLVAGSCAIIAPAAELALNDFFHLWHYPKADIIIGDEGVVSWVAMCYFFYCPPLGNLGRFLRAHLQGDPLLKRK